MPNILIRNVPEEDIARLDRNAKEQGLSREEYLRRQIAQIAPRAPRERRQITAQDWEDFAERTKDLRNEDVMRQAWS